MIDLFVRMNADGSLDCPDLRVIVWNKQDNSLESIKSPQRLGLTGYLRSKDGWLLDRLRSKLWIPTSTVKQGNRHL